MSFVNRKLYKQKPQAWGPVYAVQASIFKNAERIGIGPGNIALCMPFWFSNNQFLDYANFLLGVGRGTLEYDKNQLHISPANDNVLTINNSTTLAFDHNYTVLAKIDLQPSYYQEHYFIFDAHNGSSTGGYGVTVFQNDSSLMGLNARCATSIGFTNRSTMHYSDTPTDPFIGDMVLGWAYDKATNSINTYLDGIFRENVKGSDNLVKYATPPYIGFGKTTPYITNAWYDILLIFKSKLNYDQIAHLSDNPYGLLHRVPPVFYSVPGGGVLPIFNPLFLNAAQPTRVIQ